MPKIPSTELKYKVLEESDDLSKFDCSKNDPLEVNEFIHKEAIPFQKEKLGITYLFFHHGEIVGFVTLAMSEIELTEVEEEPPFPLDIKHYPSLLIGQLGVDNKYQFRGVGKNICLWCLALSRSLSTKIGCRFIIVYTLKGISDFYKKCNFKIASKREAKQKFFMYQQIPS